MSAWLQIRRFQFSLRALLVALTIACGWLGWTVQQARRRGRAIDAIVDAGGLAYYEGGGDTFLGKMLSDGEYVDHFWADLRHLPLVMELPDEADLDAAMGRCVEEAVPFKTLGVNYPVCDAVLRHLNGLNDGCEVIFWHDEHLSSDALAELQRRLPSVEVIPMR